MDIYEPYQRLIRIVILGKIFEVPEDNLLLRQMQFVSADIGYGNYCWNGDCRRCEMAYRKSPDGPEHVALSCQTRGSPGFEIVRLSAAVRYDLGGVLASAPAAPATSPDPG